MLFLAVFCGFLAEYQLEHTIEQQREKQFIHSLVEDLKKDTAFLSFYQKANGISLRYCDSVQQCIASTDIFTNSNRFYDFTRELARVTRYYPTDRTIQQLKNAGNMRLIRKWKVSNVITDYDSQTKLLSGMDFQLNQLIVRYRELLITFLDLSSYDKMNPPGSFMDPNVHTKGDPGYLSNDLVKAKVIYNQVFALKVFLVTVERSSASLITSATQLLKLLDDEYDIH